MQTDNGIPEHMMSAASQVDRALKQSGFSFERADGSTYIYSEQRGARAEVQYVGWDFELEQIGFETNCVWIHVTQEPLAETWVVVRPSRSLEHDVEGLLQRINDFFWERKKST